MENYKTIPKHDNYKISKEGVVINIKTGKTLNQSLTGRDYDKGKGYYRVVLNTEKGFKCFKVHVLIAISFLNHQPDGTNKLVVDHIDGNSLNNNICNLRIVTNRENLSKYKNKSSKYTGVHFHSKNKKWNSNIWHNGKKVFLGSFSTEIEAHLKYQKYLNSEVLCKTK